MKGEDVLAVIEGHTKKKLAAIKRQDQKEEEGTALAAERYKRRPRRAGNLTGCRPM
jgi:hypothetical protein